MTRPLIIQYTNLLHEHGSPSAQAVQEFLAAHRDDPVFLARARKLDEIFELKARAQAGHATGLRADAAAVHENAPG